MNKILTNTKTGKILAIASFVMILLVLGIISETPSASGYELSIYNAYSWYFWLLLILSTSTGIFLIFSQINNKSNSNLWTIGYFIVILSNIIFLSLPVIRGYAIYPQGDALSHIGNINAILSNGYIGSDDYYPFIHVLGSIFSSITKASAMQLITLIYIVNYVYYILNMYLLAKIISKNKDQFLMILIFTCPLIFSYLLTSLLPFVLAAYTIPLLLYLYYLSNESNIKMESRLLLILVSIGLVFIHPLVTFFTIILLFGLNVSNKFYENVSSKFRQKIGEFKIRFSVTNGLPFLIFIILFTWYFSFIGIQRNVVKVVSSIYNNANSNIFEYQVSTLSSAHLTLFETLKIFIYNYGAVLIYFLISACALLILLKWVKNKNITLNRYIFNFIVLAILSLLIAVVSMFSYVVVFEPIRIISIFLVIVTILGGLLVYEIFNKFNQSSNKLKRNLLVSVIFILIISANVIGILNVYGSPRIVQTNLEVTKSDITGMDWSLIYMEKDMNIAQAIEPIRRYEDLRYGTSEFNEFANLGIIDPNRFQYINKEQIPSHFGYDKYYPISKVFNYDKTYMIISKLGIIGNNVLPTNVRSEGHQYTEDDFAKLNNDSTAILIYNNGEFQAWKIT